MEKQEKTLEVAEYQPPSRFDLKQEALVFVKHQDSNLEMSRQEVEKEAEDRVEATVKYAESLIQNGGFAPSAAWPMATKLMVYQIVSD